MNLIKSSLSKQGISLVKTRQESPDIKKRLASNGCWTVPDPSGANESATETKTTQHQTLVLGERCNVKVSF